MDTELLVDNRIDDGRSLLAKLVGDGFDVTVAFWVKTSDEGLWFLYIGSTAAEAKLLGDAYQRVYACLSQLVSPSIELSDIKLIHSTSPIARDAVAVRDRLPARVPTKYLGKRLGNLSIEEAYIYPQSIGPMTRDEVLQTVVKLMSRAGAQQPSVVTLSDGTTITGVPTAITGQSRANVRVLFRDDAGSEKAVSPEDVENIQ